MSSVLTPCNHINGDVLLYGLFVGVVAVFEGPAKFAFVGSSVIVGHVEDVDGAILQVRGMLAAVPGQTLVETWVNDLAACILINVQLEEEAEEGKTSFYTSCVFLYLFLDWIDVLCCEIIFIYRLHMKSL